MGEDIAKVIEVDDKPIEAEIVKQQPQKVDLNQIAIQQPQKVDLNQIAIQQPQQANEPQAEFIDETTGEVFTQQEVPQQQKSPKTFCSFAYSTFLQRGIKKSDLVGFCDFLKVEANITNDDALTMLLEDTVLFNDQKDAFYGVS